MFNNIWTEKYRPLILNDLLITDQLKETFEEYRNKKEIPNLLFLGPPGSGKSSLAKILVKDVLQCNYLYINASDENGIDTIRNKVTNFAQTKSFDGNIKVIILDEADGISTDGQRALRNTMEEFASITRFILTGNYKHRIIEPLQSRCQSFELSPNITQCVTRCIDILSKEKVLLSNEQKPRLIELVRSNYPDLRKCINEIQKYSINNILTITSNLSQDIYSQIYNFVKQKKINEMRKFLIENEQSFSNDYPNLLRGLFNYTDKNENNLDIKRYFLLVIAEYLYKSSFVADNEINCYACLITLSEKN